MHPIDSYIESLRKAMTGADPALVQDAVYDATEHLTGALEELRRENPDTDAETLTRRAVEEYGAPDEIAREYMDAGPVAVAAPPRRRSLPGRFFGVIADGRAWTSLLYLLVSLGTGIFYFTWAVTGIGLSAGFMVLIIGLPFLGIFLASVRGIALFEGRLIQWLLGTPMPRHPIIDGTRRGWWEQFKGWLSDRSTWTALGYLLLMLPAGTFYFSLMVSLMATALGLMAAPFLYFIFHHEVIQVHQAGWVVEPWVYSLMPLAGFLLFFITLHLAKGLGRLQAITAKAMLVKG